MDEDYRQWLESQAERIGISLEFAVLAIIIDRMAKVDGDMTPTDVALMLAVDMLLVQKIMSRGKESFDTLTDKAFSHGQKTRDNRLKTFFDFRGIEPKTAKNEPTLAQIMRIGRERTKANVGVYCSTDVMYLRTYDGRLTRFGDAYTKSIDAAVSAFKRGEADYNNLMGDVVRKFAREGSQVVYKSGARRELFSAVSLNFTDSYFHAMQDYMTQAGDLFGADGVEISAHGMCAADHLPYQGRQFSKMQFADIQSTLKRPIGMYNCAHEVGPIILGVDEPANSRSLLKRYREQSAGKTGYKLKSGRELTGYEFTQWQRQQETRVRKLKVEAALMDKAGQTQDAKRLRESTAKVVDQYRKTSRAVGIETREERMNLYDWGI